MARESDNARQFARFDRQFYTGAESFTLIGSGEVGGKAQGLASIHDTLAAELRPEDHPGLEVGIPRLAVLGTDVFDAFLADNDLFGIATSDATDDRIAHAFQRGDLPIPVLGDLRALIQQVHAPLAIRSSSLLEDHLDHPFAGVYATKMIPNNQFDLDIRFRKLVEAIKFVYATTFFENARSYRCVVGKESRDEKMAVILQEVVGRRHGERFYPDVSGVARSLNDYAVGHATARDGVVSLALGLGKTIVEGGRCWSYAPPYPRSVPPFNNINDLLKNTQTGFWAVRMGEPPASDPVAETEYLVLASIAEAEADGTLVHLASTYNHESDRLVTGIGRSGPRALTFAPLLGLEVLPLNPLVQRLLAVCEARLGSPVEIEFAMTIEPDEPLRGRCGFLQVRPMASSSEPVDIEPGELTGPQVLVGSESVLGSGRIDTLRDVVYLKPDAFDPAQTHTMAAELAALNGRLLEAGRPYVLLGFGRWGTSDDRLGVPVVWSQICGARVIVEAMLPHVRTDPSLGSHFFHNITSFHVPYFTVRHDEVQHIGWDWLEKQPAATETKYLRHVVLEKALRVAVDGRSGRGVIAHAP